MREFVVYGTPVAKGRPKFKRTGNFVQTYTPEKTANYETLVKTEYMQKYGGEPFLNGAIAAAITAYFPIPKSTSKRKRNLMLSDHIRHTKKPDCDNIAKCVLDALNNVAYADDSSVCILMVKKLYAEEPQVEITLTEI